MIVRILLLSVVIGVAGCAAGPKPPPPDCVQPDGKQPIDGGIGGTGNSDSACEET